MKVRRRVWGTGDDRRPWRFVTAVCLLNLTEPGRLTHFHIISRLINCGAHVAAVGLSHVTLFKFARTVDRMLNLTKRFAYATCTNTAAAINDNSWLPNKQLLSTDPATTESTHQCVISGGLFAVWQIV